MVASILFLSRLSLILLSSMLVDVAKGQVVYSDRIGFRKYYSLVERAMVSDTVEVFRIA